MKEKDIKPTVVTYGTRMKANSSNVERVEELWKEMIEKGIKPDVISYNTIQE